jgi:hypothetical protein
MATIATTDVSSANGIALVNICIDTKKQSVKDLHTVDHPRRASIMTIAKEKISASLLYVPSLRTSGAAHRTV